MAVGSKRPSEGWEGQLSLSSTDIGGLLESGLDHGRLGGSLDDQKTRVPLAVGQLCHDRAGQFQGCGKEEASLGGTTAWFIYWPLGESVVLPSPR